MKSLYIDTSPEHIRDLVAVLDTHVRVPDGEVCAACRTPTTAPCPPRHDAAVTLQEIGYGRSSDRQYPLRDEGDYVSWAINEIRKRAAIGPEHDEYHRAQASLPLLRAHLHRMQRVLELAADQHLAAPSFAQGPRNIDQRPARRGIHRKSVQP